MQTHTKILKHRHLNKQNTKQSKTPTNPTRHISHINNATLTKLQHATKHSQEITFLSIHTKPPPTQRKWLQTQQRHSAVSSHHLERNSLQKVLLELFGHNPNKTRPSGIPVVQPVW